MNQWSDYAYASDGGGMILLLLVLGAIFAYLFFSKGFWLDKWMRDSKDEREKWSGSDIEPDYNTNQDIHDAISQENIPFTPSLEVQFDDPEVPNRPTSNKGKKKRKGKRKYTKRSKR